jgi:hypothetical protein
MTKPSDFFVGVVDLFSILLPGAMLAYLSADFVKAEAIDLTPIKWGTVEGWIVFVMAAYVFGHFVYVAGAFLEELYDPVKRLSRADSHAEKFATHIMRLRLMALPSVKGTNGADGGKWEDKLVKRMIKASVRMHIPAAALELDRIEAVSKFFRSFAIVTLIFCVSLLTFHHSYVFTTLGHAAAVLLVLLIFLFGSLGLYVYQGGRRRSYLYIYFLANEPGIKDEGEAGETAKHEGADGAE